jgi:hypothetical protein
MLCTWLRIVLTDTNIPRRSPRWSAARQDADLVLDRGFGAVLADDGVEGDAGGGGPAGHAVDDLALDGLGIESPHRQVALADGATI